MTVFHLFAGNDHYPQAGLGDYIDTYKDLLMRMNGVIRDLNLDFENHGIDEDLFPGQEWVSPYSCQLQDP